MTKKHNIGDIVYLKTDPDQDARMVTGILERPNGYLYYLSVCGNESSHYDIEITEHFDALKKVK